MNRGLGRVHWEFRSQEADRQVAQNWIDWARSSGIGLEFLRLKSLNWEIESKMVCVELSESMRGEIVVGEEVRSERELREE